MIEWTTRRVTQVLGLFVFVVAAAAYFITLTPTVPFWDSGEFIAVSNILGIPHPPGTPFYVLIGRIATLVPFASIAQRVNGLSALASALAVLLTYLTILRLIRLAQGRGPSGTAGERPSPSPAGVSGPAPVTGQGIRESQEWLAQLGAVVGALLLAFSDNFWENSIEAEVYSMMSLAQILVLWLGLKWWEDHEKRPTVGPLLVCVYVMWLCVGLHLGVGMMGLPLLALVWLVDRRAALTFFLPFVGVLAVTFGLEKMLGAVLLLSVLGFLAFAWQRKLNGWVWAASAGAAAFAMPPAFGDQSFTWWTGALAAAAVLVPLAAVARRAREGRVLALALLLMVVGYSTHLYLPIRAAQHPAINEGDPSNWANLRDLLERKQYGHTSMFERRAPLSAQLDKEFWRYWRRQWPIVPGPHPTSPNRRAPEPRGFQFALPMLLGLLGAFSQRRERVSFLTMLGLVGFATVGMILFLNFTDHEVRDRDYFFTTGYHAYAIWIGLGVTWLIAWVRDSFSDAGSRRVATAVAAVLLASQPVLLARSLWFTHDRRGNYVAHDYAYDMLAPLAPNSFVFTNGDNDTFPLWYMQQVENFRQDVRVVNLSLLNTDWYIQQLRDEQPKVPIRLDNSTVKLLGEGLVADSAGRPVMTNEWMVHHIIGQSRADDGWTKQPYFAVTVPEHMGYEPYFSLEGLVYRVNRDSLQGRMDEPATRHALYDVFKYRGLYLPDGSWDPRVYKDENASTLSRNYAAAHLQLAFHYRRRGQVEQAVGELERVSRMIPDDADVLIPLGGFYMDAGDTTRALALFQRLSAMAPDDPEVRYSYGLTLVFKGQVEPALREFDAAIAIDPNYSSAYYAAYYCLQQSGQKDRSFKYIQDWVDRHPNDTQARQMLETQQTRRRPPPGGAVPNPQ